MGAHERPLFIELRARVVSRRVFIRCKRLIARKVAADFSFLAIIRDFYFYEACVSNCWGIQLWYVHGQTIS
jgi:hypothetical protein